MITGSLGQAGLQGLRDSIGRAEAAAGRIATSAAGGDASGLVESIVDLKSAEQSAAASAKVIETAARITGTLIDTLA